MYIGKVVLSLIKLNEQDFELHDCSVVNDRHYAKTHIGLCCFILPLRIIIPMQQLIETVHSADCTRALSLLCEGGGCM